MTHVHPFRDQGSEEIAAKVFAPRAGYTPSQVADAITDGVTDIAPSQNAVYDALALKEDLANKDTDGTLAANSDTKYASQKATKTYVDAASAAMVVDSIADSDTTHAPSRNAVFDALALKAPLASPTFTGTVGGVTASMVGLGNVTNDAQTKAAIVPNTVPSAGQLLVGNAGGTAYAPVSLSSHLSLVSTGAATVQAAGIADPTHAATGKATPVDADELPLVDSAASNVLKKLTWANLKATAKAYFDTLYRPLYVYACNSSGTSLADNNSAQNIFASGFDELTLTAGLWHFECELRITSATTNTHTHAFGLAGTATIGAIRYRAMSTRSGAGIIGSDFRSFDSTSASATVLDATATTAKLSTSIRGILRVTSGGTVIPQITYSAAPGGTGTVDANSFILFQRLGADTDTNLGGS